MNLIDEPKVTVDLTVREWKEIQERRHSSHTTDVPLPTLVSQHYPVVPISTKQKRNPTLPVELL